MLEFLKTFVLALLIFLGLGMLIFYFFQRQFIYLPDRNRPNFAPAKALGFEQVMLKTKDGLQLNAWYHPANEGYPTIVHFHGNAGNISLRLYFAKPLIQQGYGILLFDYRGYGGNPGSPTEKGFYLDAEAALSFLKARQIPSDKLVLFGVSIGSGVAVEMAIKHQACALILQSPIQSLPILVKYHYPWILVPPSDKYDSITKIGKIKMPLLILHGQEDKIAPYDHAVTMYAQAHGPKKMIGFPFGHHNNLWSPDFFTYINQFLQAVCQDNRH